MTRRTSGQAALFATRRMPTPHAEPDLATEIAAAGLPEPEREFLFAAPARMWRFDYAWPFWKIALELEGGGFGRLIIVHAGVERRAGKSLTIKRGTKFRIGGRHNSGEGMQEDAIKYNRAAILGWLVVRVTTTMVRDGLALRELLDAFAARKLE